MPHVRIPQSLWGEVYPGRQSLIVKDLYTLASITFSGLLNETLVHAVSELTLMSEHISGLAWLNEQLIQIFLPYKYIVLLDFPLEFSTVQLYLVS